MAVCGASYSCEWGDCHFSSSDFDSFYEHVKGHTTYLVTEKEENVCEWRQCVRESYEEQELIRHLLFHAYHAKLKNLGLKVQIEAKLSSCILNPHARNVVPKFPEQFSCFWRNCNMMTSCPRHYYRHVDGHVGSTVKEDGRIPCEWKGVILYTRCIKKNGIQLVTLLSCLYLIFCVIFSTLV